MEMAGRVVTATAYAAIWRGQPGGRASTGRRSRAHQTCLGRPTVHWSPSGVNEYLEVFPHLTRTQVYGLAKEAAAVISRMSTLPPGAPGGIREAASQRLSGVAW